MFQFILIVAAFIILLNKIHKTEDRLSKLEKKQTAEPIILGAQPIPMPAPVAAVVVPASVPVNSEEKWGRILGIAGVVAVILGVSYFLQYAFANDLIGVTGRVIIGIIAGVAFLSVGQYVREKYRAYSNILMGCGIGLLYLTTFASFAFYQLISSPVAYGLLVGISALSVVLSIVDNAMVLATIGVVGGFLTPMFMSLSNASLAQVLTYALILDIGVMITAYAYKWRKLSATAFVGTWILVLMSFLNLYEKTDRLTMCFFLFLYFIVFLLSSIFHHVVRKEISDSTDLAVIVVNALGYTAVTYSLLYEPFKNFMGFFMIVMALLYFAVALLSFKTNKENKLLNMFLPAMSALFLTLAIPAQLDGPWIALAWFVEAIIMYALDYNLKGKNLYTYGSIVFVVSAIYTFIRYVDSGVYGTSFKFLLNERFFIFLVGIITAYVLAAILGKAVKEGMDVTQGTKSLIAVYFVVAQVASIFILTSEITQLYSSKVYAQTESLNKEITQLQQNYYTTNSYGSTNAMTEGQIDDYQTLLQEKNIELSNVTRSSSNQRNTVIDIVWILYALIAIGIGFVAKSKWFRITGMVLMAVTAVKIFIDVWELGQVYRIVTSLVFGIIALFASFIYAKYKDKLKSGAVTLLLLGLLSVPHSTYAATDKEIIQALPFKAEISSASIVQGRPTRLVVPPEVQEKTNFSDLRVFTGIGAQVPYKLSYADYYEAGVQESNLNIKNISSRNGHLEFLLNNNSGVFTHNGIDFSPVDSQGVLSINFRYSVEVYGSDTDISLDSTNWRKLSLGNSDQEKPQYIFNFYDEASKKTVSNWAVSYQPSTSKFIKVILSPLDNVKNSVTFNNDLLSFRPKSVKILGFGTEATLLSGLSDTTYTKEAKIVENPTNQSTEIYVDFPNKGILTNRVFFTTNSSDFYRNVIVQVKNDVDKNYNVMNPSFVAPGGDEWRTVATGNFYSFSNSEGGRLESLTLPYGMTKASHYRFVIYNQDNPPLSLVSTVSFNSPVAALTFVPRSSGLFYLYFGGNLNAPVYDIDSVLENSSLKQRDISTVVVSGVLSNPDYKPVVVTVPFSEKYSWLLNVVLVLLILFIAVLIISYVRKIKRVV